MTRLIFQRTLTRYASEFTSLLAGLDSAVEVAPRPCQ